MSHEPTIYIAHGFNVRDPRQFFELASFFEAEGFPVVKVDYGWTGPVRVRFVTIKEARRLAKSVRPGDVGIGHSNGCAVLARATELGAPFERLIFLNPALRRSYVPETQTLKQVNVLHASDDKAVVAGKWLRRLSPLRLVQRETMWGEMGRTGYTGSDPRVQNFLLNGMFDDEDGVGHGGAYRWDRLNTTGHLMLELATRPLAFGGE